MAEPAEPDLIPRLVSPVAPPVQPVGFRNAVAMRVGFLTASVAAMLDALPGLGILFLVWSALAGFFAVMLYQKRTGQALSVRSGAKMGWITSVLNAVILMVFSLLGFAADTADSTAKFRQQLSSMKARDPASYAPLATLLENPYGLATFLVLVFTMMFAIFTVAGTAGGALGAKVGKKN